MNKKSLYGAILLFIGSFIWGTAFVAQSIGSNELSAFAFNCIRKLIGSIALLPVLAWQLRATKKTLKDILTKDLLLGGFICGICLFFASTFQQMGIEQSTVGKSAFITTLYIVLVPILGLFLKKKVSLRVWIGVFLASLGLYLLCMKGESFVLETGDIYLLLCAFFFSIQIMAVDHFAPKVNGVALSSLQFLVVGLFSGVGMICTEIPSSSQIAAALVPILYTAIASSAIGYTLQIIGQKYLPATVASLIMSLESVFATLAGWVILHEILSTPELIGCGLVFTAVILTQLPTKQSKH